MRGATTHKETAAFEEVLLRSSPAGTLKIIPSNYMEFFYGGSQMNVGASPACLEKTVQHITNVARDKVIMPTGGLWPSRESLTRWFNGGGYGMGIGSELFPKKEDGRYDYKEVKKSLAAALEIVASPRI